MKIHLFQQCLIDMFYPHVGMAGVEVLERLGCDLVVPKKQVSFFAWFTALSTSCISTSDTTSKEQSDRKSVV